jgi:hypothetical protein
MAEVGTAFVIPADEQNGILGQVMANPIGPNPDLLAAFRGVHPISTLERHETASPLLGQSPLILANSFTVLIENGRWKNLGVFPIAERNRLYPKFKLPSAIPFLVSVESYDRSKSRPTLPFLTREIPNRFSISAKLFEILALAANGRGEWDKKFDKVLFDRMQVHQSVNSV